MTTTNMTELAKALVAYYPLMGDTDDYSDHLAPAKATSSVTFEPGPYGSAATFRRRACSLSLPAVFPSTGLGSYAVAAYVRIDGYGPVSGDPEALGTIIGRLRVRHADGVPVFEFAYRASDGSNQTTPLEAPDPLELGEWTHVLAVFDSPALEIRLFINGRAVAAGPVPSGSTPLEPTLGLVGAAAADGARGVLNGAVGQVTCFNDDLSEACSEVLAGYMTYPLPATSASLEPADGGFSLFVVVTVTVALIAVANQTRWIANVQRETSAPRSVNPEVMAQRISDIAGFPVNPAIKVTRREIGIRENDFVKLDVGGYGVYQEAGGSIAGIPGTINLNVHTTIPTSSPPNQPVPALVLMPPWDGNPTYPLEDGFANYIVMQSAPLTPTNVTEIARVLRVGGGVGLWIDQARYASEISSLATMLNTTPLACEGPNLGMDEMRGKYPLPKLQLTKEKPVSNPGSITLYNGGGYVARLKLAYTLKGKQVIEETENIPLWTSKSLGIPAEAIDIYVTAVEWTGFSWNDIGTHPFGSPVTRCYQCWGTTFDPKWAPYDCAALGVEAIRNAAAGAPPRIE